MSKDKQGRKFGIRSWGPVLTKQSFREECDVNLIVARAAKSGMLPIVGGGAFYGDVSNVPDYRTALEIVRRSEEQFMALDARLRARFNNDPAVLLAFLSDVGNRAEAEALGLVKPKPAEPAREPGVKGPEVPAAGSTAVEKPKS